MKLDIIKNNGKVYHCMILRHKNTLDYSFINLSKRHICPCRFSTIEQALGELRDRKDVEKYVITSWQK